MSTAQKLWIAFFTVCAILCTIVVGMCLNPVAPAPVWLTVCYAIAAVSCIVIVGSIVFEVVRGLEYEIAAMRQRAIKVAAPMEDYGDVECFECCAVLGYSVERPENPPFCRSCSDNSSNSCFACRDNQECWDFATNSNVGDTADFECTKRDSGDSGYLSGPMGDNR